MNNYDQSNVYRSAQVIALNKGKDDYTLLQVRILSNKEFCSACARGEGCGAVFLNQLTPAGRKKNLVELKVPTITLQNDNIQINDIIKLQTAKANFWHALSILYLTPLFCGVIIPVILAKIFLLNDLLACLMIIAILCCYYYIVAKIIRKKPFAITYAGLDYQYINMTIKKEYTGHYKAL